MTCEVCGHTNERVYMPIMTKRGLDLIKSYEQCRLTAYKAVSTEKYLTIGWGHYGADVRSGQTITQAEADALFLKDLQKFEMEVMRFESIYKWTDNEYSALVSFAYNVGSIDQLTASGTRSKSVIADKIMLYNKSGGKVLEGLTKRRKSERELFLSA